MIRDYSDNNFNFFALKLIIFIMCSFKNSQNFLMQYLPLYTSCLFMLLNKYIVNIEKSDGMRSPTLIVDKCSALFLHRSIFSIIRLYLFCINNKWCFIMFLVLIKFQSFSVIRMNFYMTKKKKKFHMPFYAIQICFLLRKNKSNSDNKNCINF